VFREGVPEQQEEAVLKEFGIRAFNFSIEKLDYDETVEKQIQQQQQMTMAVQTAIAEAKKAEQAAITAEANGKANAATAKWEQEANKARAVTIAEKDRDSCKLVMEAAEYRKKALILEGEGEATKRKLILAADGALSIKLDKWLEAQRVWAEAFAQYQGQLVPSTIMGGSFNGQNGATTFMEIMAAKAAKDLSLDMSVPKK
jgi:regulator of protease activity HflC (stomatin/prohibitin superfamily)